MDSSFCRNSRVKHLPNEKSITSYNSTNEGTHTSAQLLLLLFPCVTLNETDSEKHFRLIMNEEHRGFQEYWAWGYVRTTQRCKHTKAVMVSTCKTGRKHRKHLASAFFFYWERGGLWFKTCRNKNSKWWQFLWISSNHVSQLLVEYFKTDSWRALLLFLNVSSVIYILNSVI